MNQLELWRSIILYGLNTATYKIALGHVLAQFVADSKTHVTREELAEAFFDLYVDRLRVPKPQILIPNRLTVMERTVQRHNLGQLTREQAIVHVAREAFGDVLPRFHTVNNEPIPVHFYEQVSSGLVLTDDAFRVLGGPARTALLDELNSRWDLLEAAFEMQRGDSQLINDVRSFYLATGYERTDVTHLRSALRGYQRGICFYCGELMEEGDIHVDHLIPRQVVFHDDAWNLVLAHEVCNLRKSDTLPERHYIAKLIQRNENLVASNHPLKDQLIQVLGSTQGQRAAYEYKIYNDARIVVGNTWEGIGGYSPVTDPFYGN
ncbi:hypothetical protein BH23CHL2_BH23CHL2_06370 [soil metagenome]